MKENRVFITVVLIGLGLMLATFGLTMWLANKNSLPKDAASESLLELMEA